MHKSVEKWMNRKARSGSVRRSVREGWSPVVRLARLDGGVGSEVGRISRRVGRIGLLVALLALVSMPVESQAQERTRERDRESRFMTNSPRVLSLRGTRIRLGVQLDGNQGSELDAQGARLESVTEDSPADEAGLEEGDIITHINGLALTESLPDEDDLDFDDEESLPVQRLIAFVQELEPGEEVDIRYIRAGNANETTATAADLGSTFFGLSVDGGEFELMPLSGGRVLRFGPDFEGMEEAFEGMELRFDSLQSFRGDSLRGFYFGGPEGRTTINFSDAARGPMFSSRCPGAEDAFWMSSSSCFAGLELEELNPELGEYFGASEGVLVLKAEEDQPLGLRAGDVILSIDGREVDDVDHALRIFRSYERDESISVRVIRRGNAQTLEGTIG